MATLLSPPGITLGADDVVSVPVETPLTDGLQISISRISIRESQATEDVAQPADQTVSTRRCRRAPRQVQSQGHPGTANVTYHVIYTNGQETGRTEVSRTAPSRRPWPASCRSARHSVLLELVASSSSSSSRVQQPGPGQLWQLGRELGRHRQLRVDQQLEHQHR